MRGHYVRCANCGGHGLVLSIVGEPDECGDCDGTGNNWQYPRGAIARYYGGPLIGFDASVDTHPKGGDAKQAPSLMGSAVAVEDGQTPNPEATP